MKAFDGPGGEGCIPNRGKALTGGPAAPVAVGFRLLLFVTGEFADGSVGTHSSGSILFVCRERWNKSMVVPDGGIGCFS
jgi:hypothetical protein